MIPRVINFSDLSSEITVNGDVKGNILNSNGDTNESLNCPICSSEEENKEESRNVVQNGLEHDDVNINGEVEREIVPFSKKSIQVAASTIGISNLSSEVSELIAGELFYKVKELLFMSKMILHKNKQNTLTRGDIKKSLSMLGGVTLFGHVFSEDNGFIYVPEADVYVDAEEDVEVETVGPALAESKYTQRGEPYIEGEWLLPNGYPEECITPTEPNSYYSKLSKAILTGKPSHLQIVLKDLQTNPKIGPYCPFFLNLVALTVKKVNRDIPLTNALIATAHAIAHNRFVEPSPYLAVNRAANSLLKIVIEFDRDTKPESSNYDDLSVRVRAGLLLAKMVEIWAIELKQQIDIIRYLLQHLLEPSLPLQLHYGAIVTLAALGHRTLDFHVDKVIERYLPVLSKQDVRPNVIILRQFVIGAILTALRITRKRGNQSTEQMKKLMKMEEMLYSSFGDSITPVRLALYDSLPPIAVTRSPREPFRLRLKFQSTPRITKKNKTEESESFEVPKKPFSRDPCKFPKTLYYDASSVRSKPFTYCVSRNIKFIKPNHKSSAAGDLLLSF